ncbi:MAG: fluoride efflux transporter CrcB [Sphingobacteriaceae bacterium]|nr:fluoride efflux transporter CrcB [Sphingobacteriaceae bacterium]
MKELLLVFLGGGAGSIARYFLSKMYAVWQPVFPLATLTANFLSCVIFGLVIMLGAEKFSISPAIKLLMLTGFCGGFSTYSSFTYETVELFKSGNNVMAFSNILFNFLLSVTGLYLGAAIAKIL